MIKYLMETNSLIVNRSSTCFSQKWITLKHKFSWSIFSRFFRIFFVASVCFFSILLLIKFKGIVIPKIPTIVINQNQIKLINFTLKFSNIQKHYQMEKPLFDFCKGKQIKLVMLVMSRRESLERRMGIRNSWAKDANKSIIIRYVIGGPSAEEKNSDKLDKILGGEQLQFNDLIRYNLAEGYEHLQFKTGVAFQWQQKFCFNAEFVMKIDDDTIFDIPRWNFWVDNRFKKQLNETENGLAFFGYQFDEVYPVREKDHKWFVSPTVYPKETFPSYLHGSTYFANGKAITAIMKHTSEVYALHIEDVIYTGILAEKGNVSRFDHAPYHFRDGSLENEEECEHGQPLIFCLFQRVLSSTSDYIEEYKHLHNLKCK